MYITVYKLSASVACVSVCCVVFSHRSDRVLSDERANTVPRMRHAALRPVHGSEFGRNSSHANPDVATRTLRVTTDRSNLLVKTVFPVHSHR